MDSGEELISSLSGPEPNLLRDRLSNVQKRWSALKAGISQRRSHLENSKVRLGCLFETLIVYTLVSSIA